MTEALDVPRMGSDQWCTPAWLAAVLGPFDLDPASNARSHIAAVRSYELERGEDGLQLPWAGSVFLNPPYSNPLPWARRLADHAGPWCALLKNDSTTRWYAALMAVNPVVAPFKKRLRFEGDRAMTANFPSVLVYSAWRPPAALAGHLWLSTYARAA